MSNSKAAQPIRPRMTFVNLKGEQMTLKFKPKARQVRLIFGDGEHLSGMDHIKQSPGKVFAVIGPFDGHTDKQDLQNTLETICRGYNLEAR